MIVVVVVATPNAVAVADEDEDCWNSLCSSKVLLDKRWKFFVLMEVNDSVENGTCIHDVRKMTNLIIIIVLANNCGCCFVMMR
jgi:hypothetical protein